ncbi:extracellular glycosyl hydrolase family 78 protein [Xylariaceae sp. FL0016]|nr:extracellular glycosyl hydrolase family 78 protein [Xylariaceae sp. FL0016]
MAVSISQVWFEHHRAALGIAETQPRISWRFEGTAQNWTQSGYSLEVSRPGDNMATMTEPQLFQFNSSDSLLVPWPSIALSSAESVSVRVKAHGANGGPDTPWSDVTSVETGLLAQEDWQGAMMIASDKANETTGPHQPVLLRKEFSVDGEIASARLYITAFGMYEAKINGDRVGDAVLAPGWQSYKHRHVYDTYDVTELLQSGDNAIGIQVGEGWYAGRLGYHYLDGNGTWNNYGDTIGALALLVVTGSDGEQTIVPTDLTWGSSTAAIQTSELYDGEYYDSRLEQPGWTTTDFEAPDSAAWIGVKELTAPWEQLQSPDSPPIRKVEEVQLQNIITSPKNKTILDFGQNLVGWLELKVSGPSGHTIKLVHAEVLDEGEIGTRPLRSAKQTDHLVLSGDGEQTWEPSFTYHGFRYVEVTNWPVDYTPLDQNSVKAHVVHTDMLETGSFNCSHELLNKLISNVRWSMKGNFMSLPTDCPQRDERLGWTGDAHAFSPTANFLYDTSGFWNGWLKDVVSETLASSSIVPQVVPWIPATGDVMPTAVWSDVIVANPWNAYTSFKDPVALAAQYVGAKAWLDQGVPRNAAGLWNDTNFQFGDWLDPLSPPDNPHAATTHPNLVADAYLVYVTGLVADMASALGDAADATHYSDWAAQLKSAFQSAWISPNGTMANETQTGLVLPLYFDLFATPEHAAAAVGRLDKIIADNDYLVGTGFAGTHLLGLTLTRSNLTSTFYQMIQQTTVPSWLYQVVMNGTTTWERWDSMEPNGTLNAGEMTSFNHYAFGSVANWVFQTVGGLAPAEPGWRTVKVAAEPGAGVTAAKASYLSPYGTVATDWAVDEGGFKMTVTVPPNARAEVTLPGANGGTITVGSGVSEFEVAGYKIE